MKEVEILVEVKSSKEEIIKILASFDSRGVKRVVDLYFIDPLREELKPDKNGRLHSCFRLRKKDDKAYIAYKNDYFNDNDEWLYSDEYEIKIDDFDVARHILENLGLKELIKIESEKYIFTTLDYEVVFEDVNGLGYFLEVEKLKDTPDNQINQAKDEIRKFILGLDIKIGEEMNAGKPELMLKKKISYLK